MKIFLVGFMGAGKTTVGRELAKRLAAPFFDLDELVEAAEKMSIKELFAEKGEPYFRKRERDLLKSTHHVERAVVATSAGTFAFDENMQWIEAEGLSVYLAAPLPLLLSRMGEKSAERPMFHDDVAARELFLHRLKYYKMSDLTIEIRADQTSNEVVERLMLQLPREAHSPRK